MKPITCFAAALLVLLIGIAANGAVLTFAPLVGSNGDPFVGEVEGNFSVVPVSGEWHIGQQFGNPTPSIFGGPIGNPLSGAIKVNENTTGLFEFSGVDLAGNANPTATYQITGLRSGATVLSASGTLSTINTFVTIPSPNASQILDTLSIAITPNGASSFNVDNIVVQTVPEPSTIALVCLGFIGLAVWGWRRKR